MAQCIIQCQGVECCRTSFVQENERLAGEVDQMTTRFKFNIQLLLTLPCNVQENERLAEEVDQMRTGGRAADAREYRSEA